VRRGGQGNAFGQVWSRSTASCHTECAVAVCCSVLQCVVVCCSVLQCVAVCCSVLQLDMVTMYSAHSQKSAL